MKLNNRSLEFGGGKGHHRPSRVCPSCACGRGCGERASGQVSANEIVPGDGAFPKSAERARDPEAVLQPSTLSLDLFFSSVIYIVSSDGLFILRCIFSFDM